MSYYGVLTQVEIHEYMSRSLYEDPLFISPLLDGDQIGDTMIDLRLGQHFLIQRPSRLSVLDVFALATQTHIGDPVDEGYTAVRVPFGGFFSLHAGQTVRIGTLEYIGMPCDLQGDVTLRHSVSSIPIMASLAKIQPGYRGIVVFSLENHGLKAIKLYPGMRIAQLELKRLARKVSSPQTSRYFTSIVPEPIRIHKDEDIQYLGPSTDPIIIGIVSTIAAGRTRVVNYLKRQYGFFDYSLANYLKDIAHQQGILVQRVQLQELGNKLRREYGGGFLAKQLRLSRSWIETKHPLVIVDSFKHHKEVEEFWKQDRFYLIGIDAPKEIRKERLADRGSPRDYGADNFDEIDKIDRGLDGDSAEYHLEVDRVLDKAHDTIINDKSITELHIKIDDIVDKIMRQEL